MNVWLIKDGENLPIQPDARKMRTWMLADELIRHGHAVTWWSSTHSHQRKRLLLDGDSDVEVEPRFRLKLLHAGSYRSNRSLRRLLHHARLAAKFRRQASALPRPDVIICSFPTIELAYDAVAFALERRIPSIVDIRDPWPDVILELVPPALRGLARVTLMGLDRKARTALSGATSLVACSEGFLDWGLRKAGRSGRPQDRVFYLGRAPRSPEQPPPSARIEALKRDLSGMTTFCFVGSFGHVYELGLVCDAASRLERLGNRHVRFVLAGDGPQYGKIRARASGLNNLTLTGWLDAPEAEQLLATADVGLAPYHRLAGALPNKVFDYAAAHLPILSSLEGEMEQKLVCHGAGLSYAPGDLDTFVDHVVKLAGDTGLRREMSRGSGAMFEKEFLASSIYPHYISHVESVARGPAH